MRRVLCIRSCIIDVRIKYKRKPPKRQLFSCFAAGTRRRKIPPSRHCCARPVFLLLRRGDSSSASRGSSYSARTWCGSDRSRHPPSGPTPASPPSSPIHGSRRRRCHPRRHRILLLRRRSLDLLRPRAHLRPSPPFLQFYHVPVLRARLQVSHASGGAPQEPHQGAAVQVQGLREGVHAEGVLRQAREDLSGGAQAAAAATTAAPHAAAATSWWWRRWRGRREPERLKKKNNCHEKRSKFRRDKNTEHSLACVLDGSRSSKLPIPSLRGYLEDVIVQYWCSKCDTVRKKDIQIYKRLPG